MGVSKIAKLANFSCSASHLNLSNADVVPVIFFNVFWNQFGLLRGAPF